MGEKIVVGPINQGLRNNRKPFNIDNDSFPVLINAYQWRGRVKRKRGTSFLTRLQRRLGVTDGSGDFSITILPVPITSGISSFKIGTDTFTDPGGASPVNLITNGSGSATLDRTTGALTITGSTQINTAVIFYPTLPVLGLEDLILTINQYPKTLAFDNRYSYGILANIPYTAYDVSYYKNPLTASLPGYVQKVTWTPTSWNGQDYQQYWSVNYQGAIWVTNGITQPFVGTNIGMQFKPIVATTVIAGGPPAIVNLQITAHGLVVGDFVFVNEVVSTTGINYQTGYVITVTDANNVIVEFPNATIATNGTGGIAQYLTNRSDTSKDCIRFYDGDPVDQNGIFATGHGWVNFMPPLSQSNYTIDDLPAAVYYLVGAKMIVPFKDRLLFFGPVVQTSSGTPKYLQDAVIYSSNGTPYYTASFTNKPTATVDNPTSVLNSFNPILVPDNQTAFPPGYFEDQTGFGGFVVQGSDQPINTCETNNDVLIVGFSFGQTKLVFSGNDIIPFSFYLISNELGSGSTFSSVNMGDSVLSRGSRGYISTDQSNADRFDLQIPDEVFQIRLQENGAERFTAIRDYLNEWIYFSYPKSNIPYKFPSQTLQFNYRDNSFAQFNESYTTYGLFRKVTGNTWANIGSIFPTWGSWNEPWNSGSSNLLQPQIIGGNQQGFVIVRDDGTNESNSLAIQNIVSSTSTVTSPNHNLETDDYIVISGATGTVASSVNGKIFSVFVPSSSTTTFILNPPLPSGLTYLGGGLIKRMYVPFIQTKQFPSGWGMGRKTRIGVQQYLLTATAKAQIQLLIYLSQNADDPYNDGPIVPASNSVNNSLIYSTVLYTCPESSNLGLTPANSNLQMICDIDSTGTNASSPQAEIWHRMNTSLIGDTVQLGFSLSDAQMRDPTFTNQFAEIELHGFVIDVSASSLLS